MGKKESKQQTEKAPKRSKHFTYTSVIKYFNYNNFQIFYFF